MRSKLFLPPKSFYFSSFLPFFLNNPSCCFVDAPPTSEGMPSPFTVEAELIPIIVEVPAEQKIVGSDVTSVSVRGEDNDSVLGGGDQH